jgi:Restriction endonuclease AspBHI N-terminal
MTAARQTDAIPYAVLEQADLIVDQVYLGGRRGSMADDPIARLLPVGTLGGFRYRGQRQSPSLVVLYTSLAEPDWPDVLDDTGLFTYYGDNRQPGRDLHGSPRGGNLILRRTFDLAHGDQADRRLVPPHLLFAKAGCKHSGADVWAGQVLTSVGGIQGLPRMAWWSAVMMLMPCLRAVEI